VATVGALAMSACGSSDDSSSPPATSVTTGRPATYAATLQAQIPQVMKENAIPGVIVLVRSRDQGDWSVTFGTAEIGTTKPMSMDDSFRIGSNTKTMTSTVILQLVQEGKLSLDDPLDKYVPGFPNGDRITVAQLAEMRSGLYSYSSDLGFNETLDKEPQKAWTPDELLAIARPQPPLFAPGAQFDYSNTNTVLLGIIIEKVTGMSASEAFQKRIFEPLGLKHTLLPAASDSALPDPHPQGYQFLNNVATIDSYAVPPANLPAALDGSLKPINYTNANPSWAWTAGGAISTADDLATYVEAMVSSGKLLDAQTEKLRIDSIVPVDPGTPDGVGYGLGLVRFPPTLYGHDGQLPGFSAFMAHDPETDTTIIIATNLSASPVDGENASVVIAKPVIATVYDAPAAPGGDPAPGGGPVTTLPVQSHEADS
jgi:D-alanyl-D-alanine carboxypeptidase